MNHDKYEGIVDTFEENYLMQEIIENRVPLPVMCSSNSPPVSPTLIRGTWIRNLKCAHLGGGERTMVEGNASSASMVYVMLRSGWGKPPSRAMLEDDNFENRIAFARPRMEKFSSPSI